MDPVDQAQPTEEAFLEESIRRIRHKVTQVYYDDFCRECGDPIPVLRQGISPWCVDCAREKEFLAAHFNRRG